MAGYSGDLRFFPDDGVTAILLQNLEGSAAFLGDKLEQVIFQV